MSTLNSNAISNANYFDQITQLLDQFYITHPIKITPLEQLRLKRNQLIREMNCIVSKFFELEQECFSLAAALRKEADLLNLSIDILDEISTTHEQIGVLTNLVEKDIDLSEAYLAYEQELIELDLEILSLETQS